MRAKSAILLVMALGCGLVAAVAIKQVLGNRTAETAVIEMAPIYVALETIPPGEVIPIEMLKLEEWPKDKIPPGSLSTIEDLEDRRTRQTIFKGSPLLDEQLFGAGERKNDIGMTIPKNFRVVTVKVDDVSGSASLIKPHDRVDVLVHLQRNPSKGIEDTVTKTLLQDIKVFAVGTITDIDGEVESTTIKAKTASLLVTPKQAELVMLASELGKIRLIMRGSTDTSITAVDPGTSSRYLSENASSPSEDRLKKPVVDPQKTGGSGYAETWRVKLIKGSKVEEVVMRLPSEARDAKQPGMETGRSLWETVPPSNAGGHSMQHESGLPSNIAELMKSEMAEKRGSLDEKISAAIEETASEKKSTQAESAKKIEKAKDTGALKTTTKE